MSEKEICEVREGHIAKIEDALKYLDKSVLYLQKLADRMENGIVPNEEGESAVTNRPIAKIIAELPEHLMLNSESIKKLVEHISSMVE